QLTQRCALVVAAACRRREACAASQVADDRRLLMAFEGTWTDPYYTGSATSSAVPGTYPLAIGGHPYMIDTAAALQDQFTQESVPYIVRYAFYTGSLGEDTLNPDPAWRESVRSWQDGAGQIHYDTLTTTNIGVQSDPFMFRASKGIDVWT